MWKPNECCMIKSIYDAERRGGNKCVSGEEERTEIGWLAGVRVHVSRAGADA